MAEGTFLTHANLLEELRNVAQGEPLYPGKTEVAERRAIYNLGRADERGEAQLLNLTAMGYLARISELEELLRVYPPSCDEHASKLLPRPVREMQRSGAPNPTSAEPARTGKQG
jgi:hypothetical protein